VKNVGWNGDILAGQAVEFGFTSNESFVGFPTMYELVGGVVDTKADAYAVEYIIDSDWDAGFTGRINITNQTAEVLEDWMLEFDYDSNIDSIWNAEIISHENNHYILKNVGYNGNIQPNATISFGFMGTWGENKEAPRNFSLKNYAFNQYVTVTFECNGENVINAPEMQTVLWNTCVSQPVAPSLVGYSFVGWYMDEEGTKLFDFSTPITENMVLYAKWSWIYDNLNDNIIDIGDIEYLRAEDKIEAVFDEEGRLCVIMGKFTEKRIQSVEDAAVVLNMASTLFGSHFRANASDITVKSVGDGEDKEYYYKYSPEINGMSVIGSDVIISTYGDGEVNGLFNYYVDAIKNMNTVATITVAEVEKIVCEQVFASENIKEFLKQTHELMIAQGNSESNLTMENVVRKYKEKLKMDTRLLIYAPDMNEIPELLYAVDITGNLVLRDELGQVIDYVTVDKTYYVCANENAGQIHSVISNLIGIQEADSLGQLRNIEIDKQDNKWVLRDVTRNIETHKGITAVLDEEKEEISSEIVMYEAPLERSAVTIHANMSTIYDYYKKVLDRDSYDGNGGKIVACYGLDGAYDNNASWRRKLRMIVFGENGAYQNALDITAHEFTHGVFDYVVGVDEKDENENIGSDGIIDDDTDLRYEGESGALEEAYADVLGCIIEGKGGESRWLIGEDKEDGALRDISNPLKYGQPNHYDALSDEGWLEKLNEYPGRDNEGVHLFSGVFSFALYNMMIDERTANVTDEEWAKVLYQSIYCLKEKSNFMDGRRAIISVAKKAGFDNTQLQAIRDAFDNVGITEPNSVRIVLTWGQYPWDLDAHLSGSGFHVYYRNQDVGYAELDYDDRNSFGPEIITISGSKIGSYVYTVHNYSGGDGKVLTQSGAKVNVYKGPHKLVTLHANPNEIGLYWRVLEVTIVDEETVDIQVPNRYSMSSSGMYY